MSSDPAPFPQLVRDLMTVGVVTCPPHAPLAEVARLFLAEDLEGVVVLDDEGHSIGVITQDELIRGYTHPEADSLTAQDIMRSDIPEIPPDIPLAAAAQLMQDKGVRIFFLMHHAKGITWPAGVISYRHLLRRMAAQSAEELRDLGIKAKREPPLDAFRRRIDAARRQS